MSGKAVKRSEVPDSLKWHLSDLYPSDAAFRDAAAAYKKKFQAFGQHKGHITDSPENLYTAISEGTALQTEGVRLFIYGMTRNDSDTTNPEGTKLMGTAQSLMVEVQAATSFMDTEIASLTEAKFNQFLASEPRLKEFQRTIESNYIRRHEHVLPADQEEIIAKTGEISRGPENIYSVLNDGDLKFGEIKDENGKMVELTNAKRSVFAESLDRDLRKRSNHQAAAAYDALKHTFAATLSAHMSGTVLNNRLHHFKTAREGELFNNEIPESVYDTLTTTVHDHLQSQHEYMKLRQDVLGLDPMYRYDSYAPLLGDPKLKFTFDESKDIVLDALKVLGDDYLDGLKHEFNEGWIDAAENEGKRSGGYQTDVYGVHPLVLLNWSDNYDGLTTLAHESGHAMQSYFTDQNQPAQNADYPIFTAEIASTTNENLLMSYMLEKYADNKPVKAYLLQNAIQTFIGTVNTQTMFAEFEHQCYEQVEAGETLTADHLGTLFADLEAQYLGDAVTPESKSDSHWAVIPHFYMNYYVYQYATSMAISKTLADRIWHKQDGALDQYKTFLKAGNSMDPISLIKAAGVDVTSRQYIDDAFAVFDKQVAELRTLLGK